MEPIGEIIDRLGGATELARALGLRHASTVSEWKRRAGIPAEYWRELIDLATARNVSGVTSDVLMAVHARSPEGNAT